MPQSYHYELRQGCCTNQHCQYPESQDNTPPQPTSLKLSFLLSLLCASHVLRRKGNMFFSFLHDLQVVWASIHQELRRCLALTQDSYTTYWDLGHQFPRNQEPWSVDDSGMSVWAHSFYLWAPTHEYYNKVPFPIDGAAGVATQHIGQALEQTQRDPFSFTPFRGTWYHRNAKGAFHGVLGKFKACSLTL